MNKIVNKLRSESGASILIALLLFLVTMMVCAVIISAASTTIQRTKSNQEFTQSSLAYESAASLIRDELLSEECLVTLDSSGKSIRNVSATGTFKYEVEQSVRKIFTGSTTHAEGSLEIQTTQSALPTVPVSYVFKLENEQQAGDDSRSYRMVFTLGDKSTDSMMYVSFHIDYVKSGTTEKYTWTSCEITGKKQS